MMDNLDNCVQLHERIEIHYYVSHYEAQLYTWDYSGPMVLKADGNTIAEALTNLNKLCEGHDCRSIRQLAKVN